MIRGRDLLPVARSLTGNEARLRSAVSRAYYAAFSEMGAYIGRWGYARAENYSHDRAWNFFKNQVSDKDVERKAARRAAADTGFRLRERRQKADYALSQTLSLAEKEAASIRKFKPSSARLTVSGGESVGMPPILSCRLVGLAAL